MKSTTTNQQYGILETQEERDNFLQMDYDQVAEFVYEIWKQHNFKIVDLLPKGDGACAGDNADWWDEAVAQDRVMYDSLREYRDALELAEERTVECKMACAECPLIAQCLTSATCMPGDKPGELAYESGSVYGGHDAEEHAIINEIVASLWDEDFKYGGAKVSGMSRFEIYEEDLREEFGDAEFERMRAEALSK